MILSLCTQLDNTRPWHYEDPRMHSLKIDKNSIKSNAHRGGSFFLAIADIWHDYFQLFS